MNTYHILLNNKKNSPLSRAVFLYFNLSNIILPTTLIK